MTPATLRIALPPKLIPVFHGPADVRGAYGGRGSAKTRSFAMMTAVKALMWESEGRDGIILSGRQYMNSLEDSSLEEIKSAIRSEPLLEPYFDIGEKYIRTKSGRIHYVFSGLERNIESVKSKSRILLCWVDEAEPVTESSWKILIPTLREEDSELWVTWNPRSKRSATHERFRKNADASMKIVEMNWRDNPAFPAKLERQRVADYNARPDSYNHIWEGGFEESATGAYFAKHLIDAREDGRIGRIGADPYMIKRIFVDIGGTGARADAFAMWVAQFVGREVRVLDHYEMVGQPIGAHLEWLRRRKYLPNDTQIFLPHDGDTNDRVIDVSYRSAFESAMYDVEVIPNQGKGAATQRIEALRRVLPRCWFNEDTTAAGREALAWYHEKRDENRDIGLGPEHDWASHSSDAAGLMALIAERDMQASGAWYSDWDVPINGGRQNEDRNGYRRHARA